MIRKARSNDAAVIAAIGYRAWEEKISVWSSGQMDIAQLSRNAKEAYERFVRDCLDGILVAEEGGVVAGWGAREHPRDVPEPRDNVVSDLWVDPDHQGKGHGVRLLDALEAEIRAAGFHTAELETHARNHDAIAFYKRRGYAVIWLSTVYSASLDRDIEKVGLRKELAGGGVGQVPSPPFG